MHEPVKSISLDDIVDIPNPIGMQGEGEKTKNKALHYNPKYEDLDGQKFREAPMQASSLDRPDKAEFSLSTSLTNLTAGLGNMEMGKKNLVLIGILTALLAAAAVYFLYGDELFPPDAPVAEAPQKELEPVVEKKVAPAPVPEAPKVVEKAPTVEAIPGNPYWKLPNTAVPPAESPRLITAQETANWRAALEHPFTYHRFKTIQEMRAAHAEGSESILYEALSQKKFWARMEALLALAEMGVAIDTQCMRTAIGDAHSDLVRNYFRRFHENYNDATVHVMHQALRVVDARSRLIILETLAKNRSEQNDFYLIAATSDEDAAVKSFATSALKDAPVAAKTRENYNHAISDYATMVAPGRGGKTTDIKVEKIPSNMNVEQVYFLNDEEAPPPPAPVKVAPKEVDDGFNTLKHVDHEGK